MDVALFLALIPTIQSLAFVIAQIKKTQLKNQALSEAKKRIPHCIALVLCLKSLVVALDLSMCFLYHWFAFLANHIGT